MEITRRELTLAFAIAAMGFIFSMHQWILYLNTLTPFSGFLIYYTILYVSLYIMGKMGLVVFGIKIESPLETLGLLLISVAFFCTISWESPFVQIVVSGSATGAQNISPVYFQAEDGVLWWLWNSVAGITDIETLRWLTYVISPFFLALIGLALVSKRVRLDDGL